jgi:hypothetical protein
MTSKFAQYAAEKSRRTLIGDTLKYKKGEWQTGQNKDLVSPDKRFVAIMSTLSVGHVKWGGGQPVDSRLGLVADDFRPVHRNELDDLDSDGWELGEDGDRVDPWQPTTLLLLASLHKPHPLFTFSTGTVGGNGAIEVLCAAHGRTTEQAGQYPVVTLASDYYDHKIKSRGRVHFPVFNIVDAVEAGPFDALILAERGGAGFLPASVSSPALESPRRGPISITSGRDALDDNDAPWAPPIEEMPDGPDRDDGRNELGDDIPF